MKAVSSRAIVVVSVVSMLALASAQQQPSRAATTSQSFTVSATVAAACAVAWPALLGSVGALRPEQVCAPGAALSAIRPPPPTVTLVADPAAGLSRLTVVF